jgi:hypothetical protein
MRLLSSIVVLSKLMSTILVLIWDYWSPFWCSQDYWTPFWCWHGITDLHSGALKITELHSVADMGSLISILVLSRLLSSILVLTWDHWSPFWCRHFMYSLYHKIFHSTILVLNTTAFLLTSHPVVFTNFILLNTPFHTVSLGEKKTRLKPTHTAKLRTQINTQFLKVRTVRIYIKLLT